MNILKNNVDNQPLIADLNKILLESLKANHSSVSISYYVEDDGDILIDQLMEMK
jgi:hypothetical protein